MSLVNQTIHLSLLISKLFEEDDMARLAVVGRLEDIGTMEDADIGPLV